MASIVHAAVLPFADLVLLSSHSCWAVVFGQVLAVLILKEKFIMRYDLPALAFIITGALLIVCNANYETIEYSKEQIYRLLFSPLNLTIYSILCMMYFANRFMDYQFSLQLA